MSETILVDVDVSEQFTIVPNALIRDETISIEARGTLIYICSHGKGWKSYRGKVMKDCGYAKKKYDRIMRELKEAGYVKRVIGGINGGSTLYVSNKKGCFTEGAQKAPTLNSEGAQKAPTPKSARRLREPLKKTNGLENTNFYKNSADRRSKGQRRKAENIKSGQQGENQKIQTINDPYGVIAQAQTLDPENCKNQFAREFKKLAAKMTVNP